MAKIVRTEVRQRGIVGKIFKWSFIGFNLLMVFVMLKACSATSDVMTNAHSDAEQAGTAIGATMASGMLLTVWVAGVVILGAMTMFTRGKKVIVEETAE